MSKILKFVFIGITCVLLVGCGSEKIVEEKETNKTSTNENVTDETEDENDDDLKLISTDDKLIFTNTQGFYMIFNYEGETLKNIEWVMDYENKEAAQIAYNIYNTDEYKNEYDVSINGSEVTLTYKEDYADQTYGAISKSEMETYMSAAGYTINR
jgi:hypothetical protein